MNGLSPSAAGAQAAASSAAPPPASSAAFVVPVSQSDSAEGGTIGFTPQEIAVAAMQSKTASTPAELQHAHGLKEKQNSSTHRNGNSQGDGRPHAYDYLKHLSAIWDGVFVRLDSLEHENRHLSLGFGWELFSLLHVYINHALDAAMEAVQKGDFSAYESKTKMYHANFLDRVEYWRKAPTKQLRKREALIEHLMPGTLVGLKDCIIPLDAPILHSARFFIPMHFVLIPLPQTSCMLSLSPHTGSCHMYASTQLQSMGHACLPIFSLVCWSCPC